MEEKKISITDIQIPFGRMVAIILKFMLAAIPAIFLMYLIIFVIAMIFYFIDFTLRVLP